MNMIADTREPAALKRTDLVFHELLEAVAIQLFVFYVI